ncbi:MAG TPA: hypothetical protein VNO75_05615 [Gemmatimonadaceae bacterium]|nr:hypothetical protein [Gemmatimonadaceae bacterium]
MSAITITEDGSPVINSTNDIRIRIPTGFGMTWNTSITTATITGSDAGKVSTTVTYENSGQVLRVNVTSSWSSSDQIIISGLQFNNFTAVAAPAGLQLVTSGSAGGATVATDARTKQIIETPAFTESANQTFVVGNPAASMNTATITDATAPMITATNNLRLRIPASVSMTWNTAATTATIGGAASGKVSTAVTYEDAGKTLVIDVTSDFAGGDQITVSGLEFNNFSAASGPAALELVASGSGGATTTVSDRTKRVVQPTILSAANQVFSVGDAATTISTVTITDNSTFATVTAANDIRVRIPAGLNMTWNAALTTATIGGGAAAKVSTAVSYEDAGKTLVLNATSDFATSDQITVAGLQYDNFSAASPTSSLELAVSGPAGATAATDARTKFIYPALSFSSAADQVFAVNAATTSISAITITEDGSPSITATNDIRIRIPAGVNMLWNTSDLTATLSGADAGKVSTTVSYEEGGKVVRLNVTTSFAAADQIIVSGLSFNTFTAASPAGNLQLVVSGAGGAAVTTDDRTKTIVGPTLSSAANQTFAVADPATAMSALTITEDAADAAITSTNDIRIRVPAALNLTWNTAVTTATLSGSATGKVSSTVTYESGGNVLRLNVTSSFANGDQITVSGLEFSNFTAPSAAQPLELVVSGSAVGTTAASDDKTKAIVRPALTEAVNQIFTVGDPATAMLTATVTDDVASATITAAGDIRLRIPAALNMTWNTATTTATIGGAAAGKVSTTVTYEDAGKTLVLDVTSNFAAGDQITVSGLEFNNFSATSAATALQLVISGASGGTASTSDRTKQIVQPSLASLANMTFTVGDPAVGAAIITVIDNATAPTITAADDLRIRIPAGFNMTWNTALTTATIGGPAAAKVSPTVSYEDGGRTLVLDVTADFVAGNQITVSGVQFDNFTAISGADNLQLVVSGAGGGTAVTDTRTIQIFAPLTISSAADQVFAHSQGTTTASTITVFEDGSPTLTASANLRIRIPTGFGMTWNTADGTATLSGSAAAKVSTIATYEAGGQVLVLNITTNFAGGDQLIISGVQFNNFSALSPADNLELVTAGSAVAATAATDDKTIRVVIPSVSGSANQTFIVGDAATAMAPVTVTDDATLATINSTDDIRLRIPTGFNMSWNTGITTATITGSAAGKVSTFVTYENSGQVLRLNVTSSFAPGDQIVVSGPQFTGFTAGSPASSLELVISGAFNGPTAAVDDKTKTILAPSFTEAANQVFTVSDAATAMSTATVTDAATAPTMTAANDIRLRIPASVDMLWNTGMTTATIGGAAAGKVSTAVTYEDGAKTLVLNVTSDFAAGDQITIAGLQYASFTTVSGPGSLQLVVSGTGGGTAATSNATKQIFAQISLSSFASQTFNVGSTLRTISTITVRGDASSQINATNDIRIRIPAALSMTWNTADVTATIGGADAAKVSTTVSYEDAGKTLVLNVVTNFAPGDVITIGGLQYNDFTAISPATSLELATGGAGSPTVTADNQTRTILAAFGISSAADQTFIVGQAATAATTFTITEDDSPQIGSTNDIRIRIPTGFAMTWNTSITTATITGTGAGRMSTTVSYESSGRVLRLNVISSFNDFDEIVVSGLQFTNFTAPSAADNLELVTSGSSGGSTANTDDRTKIVYSYGASVTPATTAESQLPSNGTNYTVLFALENTGSTTDNYDLLVARNPGTAVSTVSIAGAGVTQGANPDSARLTGLGAGASMQITVTYSVANVGAGTTDVLTLTTRSATVPTETDTGVLTVTVIKPNINVSRGRSPLGSPPPATEITHTITITNAGNAPAADLVLADSLGSNSDFKLGSVATNLPAGISVALEYSSDGGSSWTYSPASGACGAPAGFDGCVNRIRWRLLSSLSAVAPNHTGNVQFISRIR